jgi:hypothetical protein
MGKKILCVILILFGLVGASSYAGEENPWFYRHIIKDDSDSLSYVYSHGKCPATKGQIENDIEGLLVRSRIKPINGWVSNAIFLNVDANCAKLGKNSLNYDYSIRTRFCKFNSINSEYWCLDLSNVRYGVGKQKDIRNIIEESVEEFLTEYIKANFNL